MLKMSNHGRAVSEMNVYHVMVRGVNKQKIFLENEDKVKFLYLLKKNSIEMEVEVHAFCLMDNHVHLLVKSDLSLLSNFMQLILVNYVRYFNTKTDRVGHLFENRYKSEPINDEAYYLTVIRYILQNPEKAFIGKTENYQWSSINAYNKKSFVKTDFIESLFNCKKNLIKYLLESNNDECLDLKLTNEEENVKAFMIINMILGRHQNKELTSMSKQKRNFYLHEMKKNGISVRRIANITGVPKGIVERA